MISTQLLKDAKEMLSKNEIPARIIHNQQEAREMNESDPIDREWVVGDEYYMIYAGRVHRVIK